MKSDLIQRIAEYIKQTQNGKGDSDQHVMTLFSLALGSKAKMMIELGVRSGTTTKPLRDAAELNGGFLFSVDIDKNPFDINFSCLLWKMRSCANQNH